MFNTFYSLNPEITQRYNSRLQIIFRQHIQPWHPSSTLTHEAGAAVLRLSPEKFWAFSAALFKVQSEFFDVNVVNETRNQTYERLAQVAGSVGVDAGKVFELLKIPDTPAADGALNVGNQVTNDIKWIVKVCFAPSPPTIMNIGSGIGSGERKELHQILTQNLDGPSNWCPRITNCIFQCKTLSNRNIPTTNNLTQSTQGVEERGISSGFSTAQWEEWLAKNVV